MQSKKLEGENMEKTFIVADGCISRNDAYRRSSVLVRRELDR